MNKKKNIGTFLLLIAFISMLVVSCKEDNPDPVNKSLDTILRVNKFISENMEEYYLWTDQMPQIDYKKQPDPFKYFESLLYYEDKWSFITDDYEGLKNSFQGSEKTYGYSLTFGAFSNSDTYFAIVQYVNPNTAASRASLKRGDIIISINGKDITEDNYLDLFYSDNVTLGLGVLTETGIGKGESKTMSSEQINVHPIFYSDIIEIDNKKIGYVIFNQYIEKYMADFDVLLSDFKTAGITDLVLDLRYNPGGDLDAAVHLCSALAPVSVVDAKSPLVKIQWNAELDKYWRSQNRIDQLIVPFDPKVTVKMNLNKVYILAARSTASASELTITGLEPYMDVVVIGKNTSGKYTGSITIQPQVQSSANKWVVDQVISNWAIQPIVFRYSNSQGVTNFKNGFTPDYIVEDELLPAIPLGEITEPLLAKAIELITDGGVVAMKSAPLPASLAYRVVDQRSSRFQPFIETLRWNIELPGLRE